MATPILPLAMVVAGCAGAPNHAEPTMDAAMDARGDLSIDRLRDGGLMDTNGFDAVLSRDAALSQDGAEGHDGAGSSQQDATLTPAPCAALQPSADASVNSQAIDDCLAQGVAVLAAGDFPVLRGIHMPPGAVLRGQPGLQSRIYAAPAWSGNTLVSLGGGNAVANLRLDGMMRLSSANGSIIGVGGNNSTVDDVELYNSGGPHPVEGVTGVYFICEHCSGNVVRDAKIHSLYFGVIFRTTLNATDVNTVQDTEITNISCDSVSIGGFGRVINNHIHKTGWGCNNGGIPGGGIYVLDNKAGAEIIGNKIHDQCGMNIDIDGAANLVIRDNLAYDPGYPFAQNGKCNGAPSVLLVDTQDSVVENNTFLNMRSSNRLGSFYAGDPNIIYGQSAFSDLPAGGNTLVAFALARRQTPRGTTTGNKIQGNTFRAYCNTPCLGVGYFTSRSTGLDLGGNWSSSTTNYFTSNTPVGSNFGSKRCGANWFAANVTCTDQQMDPSCNVDDPQHTGPFRSDEGCRSW